MSLVVLASAKGAPGVTTTIAALAHVWPAAVDPVLIELDPSGGDLTGRFGLTSEPGLVTLAARSHRSGGSVDLMAHAQPARGVRVIPAPPGRAAGRAASLLGPALGAALTRLARDTDVLVDAGRVDDTGPDGPCATRVLAVADVVAVVCRTSAGDLAHAVSAVVELQESGWRAGLVPIGTSGDVGRASRAVAVPVLGSLPDDPRGAAAMAGFPVRPWLLERLPLVRAARGLADVLTAEIGSSSPVRAPDIALRSADYAPVVESGGVR